jgi:DNA-binding CsgD family transcriptional regulator
MVDELRRAIGFDAYAFLLTDPQTCVGSSPLADVPGLHELPRLIRLKYLTRTNRWTKLDVHAVGLLQEATNGDPERSLLWNHLRTRYDIADVASLVFRDRFGCWGFLDLWRSGAGTRFHQDEAGLLSDLTSAVTTALRRTQANTFVARSSDVRRGPLVLLLSSELDVLSQTPETHDYLRVLVPPAQDRPPIPASAYNVAAQLLAVEAGVDANPPRARVHLSDGLWLTLRAARIGDDSKSARDRDIAVTIEEAAPAERVDLFVRAFGLSPRERELVGHLATGCDTREVAIRMFLSEHTVQDHLKSVFAKTMTNNRRTLLSRVLGSGSTG